MAGRWLFTKEQLSKTPSIKHGYSEEMEAAYRTNCANLIQSIGQRLQLTQLCMNTAIVYMHRFYMFHPLQKFNWRSMAAACLFLSAKVEEQPKKIEHIIKAGHFYIRDKDKDAPTVLDVNSSEYLNKAQDLVIHENILLQTLGSLGFQCKPKNLAIEIKGCLVPRGHRATDSLNASIAIVVGFNVTIDHSNTHIIKLCKLVKVPKDLSQLSYFLSTNSLLLTNMCVQHSPEVIAAVAIHLACKWKDWEFQSREGKLWWQYVAQNLSHEKLEEISKKYLTIMEKANPELKRQLLSKLQMADASPNSRGSSPAPHRPSPAPHRPSPHHSAHRPHPSQHHTSHHPPPEKGHSSSSSSGKPDGSSANPAKTYAEHRERSRTSTPTSDPNSSKSRPLHGESPLVKGDLKRSYPKDPHSSSHSNSSSKSNSISPHPGGQQHAHNPYSQPRNHEKSRHHHRHHSSSSTLDGSPMKKARVSGSENGNGAEKRPPLPPQPPLPRPPPPP